MLTLKKILNQQALRQIILSFGFRIITPFIMLVTTPALISNLGYRDYGAWSLLITTMGWLTICDFGLTNQVRNESKLLFINNKNYEVRELFTAASIISSLLCVIFVFILYLTHLDIIYKLFLAVSFFLVIQVNLCRAILLSINKPEIATAIVNIPNLIMLLFVMFASDFDLKRIMLVYAIGCILMLFISYLLIVKDNVKLSIVFFKVQSLKDSLNKYSILKGGFGFFTVQIVSMGLVLSDRYIIAYLFGNDQVSKYDIIFKVANFCIMFFSVINTVLWSKFTELWIKKEFEKIRKIFRVFDLLAMSLVIILFASLHYINFIIEIWLGVKDIHYDLNYIAGVVLYLLGFYIMSAYSSFLNGSGIIKPQFVLQLIVLIIKVALLIIPIYIFKIDNVNSVIYIGGSCLCLAGVLFRGKAYAQVRT